MHCKYCHEKFCPPIAANDLLRIAQLASFCPIGESRCSRNAMAGNAYLHVHVLANSIVQMWASYR